jgi:hypothetical protein
MEIWRKLLDSTDGQAHGREGGRDGMAWHGMARHGIAWDDMAAFSRAVEGSGLVQKEGGRRGGEPNPRRRRSKIGGIR